MTIAIPILDCNHYGLDKFRGGLLPYIVLNFGGLYFHKVVCRVGGAPKLAGTLMFTM